MIKLNITSKYREINEHIYVSKKIGMLQFRSAYARAASINNIYTNRVNYSKLFIIYFEIIFNFRSSEVIGYFSINR